MRKHSIYFTALILIFSISIFSCKKKDKDTDNGNYMVGILDFKLQKYMIISQEIKLNATGITDPTKDITYSWVTNGFSLDSIAGQTVTLMTPSIPGDYSISVTAKHKDFNSKVATRTITILDPSSEENFSGIIKATDSFTDIRDGNKYYYRKIGKLNWLTTNLRWAGAGKQYDSIAALNEIFGTLYSWDEATGGVAASGLAKGPKGVCPQGWSIPTREDWEDLGSTFAGSAINFDNKWVGIGEKAAANASLNKTSIWKYSPNNIKTNTMGWNALPGGNSSNYFKSFANINLFGFWWSASEKDSNNGEYRFIHFDSSDFPYNYASKSTFAASVRCVKLATE